MSAIDEFVECETCRVKPGSPILCADCLTRRNAWLKERGYAEPFGRRLAPGVMKHIAMSEKAKEHNKTMLVVGKEPAGFRDLYWCAHQNEPTLSYGIGRQRCRECNSEIDDGDHHFLGHVLKP